MVPVVLALALLFGCSGHDEPEKPAEVVKPVEQVTPEQQLADARTLALQGKHEEALALAEKVLAKKPKDDAVWRLMEQEAIAADQTRALLGRLDAAKAVGDATGPHFLLRATLALASDQPAEALSAAKLASAADADGAAPLIARAARALAAAGAPTTETLPAGATALLSWLDADPKEQAALRPAAEAVAGWRAALLRAQTLEAQGDVVGAIAQYGSAAAADDPRAKILGDLGRARLAAKAGSGVSPADAGAWAGEAAKTSLAEGDGEQALDALELSVAALVAAGRYDDALTNAHDLAGALPKELEAPKLGRASLASARAALAAGKPADALEAAAAAREKLADNADRVGAAAWIEGLAAFELGRADAVAAAADRCDGQRKLALQGLAAVARDDLATASAAFPTTGLDPREGAVAWLQAARADSDAAKTWLDRAVAAADASGELGLRIGTRLAAEDLLRTAGDSKGAAALRASTLALAAEGIAGDPLRAEIALRTMLDGGKATVPPAAGLPAVIGAWSALAAGQSPPLAGDDPLAAGPAAWAEGRAAIAAGTPDAIFGSYADSLGKLPLHRQGTLSLGTVLDGSEGVPADADMAALTTMGDNAPIDAWFAVHELSHRLDRFERAAQAGVDYTSSLPQEKREALRGAIARARAGVSAWLAGEGEYPKADLAAVGAAEAGLANQDGLGPILPRAMTSPTARLEELGGVALISYRVGAAGVHGVAVSKRGSAARLLGPSSKILQLVRQHRATLEAGAKGSGPSAVGSGDRVRTALLDPFDAVLSGVGRYIVLAPEPLDTFSFGDLPENESGLRWLADIRNISVLPSLSALDLPTHKIETYNPDFLGFASAAASASAPPAESPPPAEGAPAEGATQEAPLSPGLVANELAASSRVFPAGLKTSAEGAQATVALWKESAKTSRYIHITALQPSPDGGFMMADGPLSLNDIRATPLGAELVVVSAPGSMDVQRLRAQALLDAGAHGVLVAAWAIPDATRARYFGAYYEAIGRDRPPAQALSEGRSALRTDTLAGAGGFEPGIWGSFLLYGAR